MDARSKTCLFCLKPRQILVDNPQTAKAITEIYNVELPQDGCRICIECHFNIARVQDFKRTIENATDIDVDSCFVCKSENTVDEPGVDRVVDYLIKKCTTIDFGNTDTIKACVTCIHVLETSIKYEKMARNYANAQRFCKQYSTLRECNVALWKIDLDSLGELCDDGGGRGFGPKHAKNKKKRARSSFGRDEGPSKKSKLEDGSVLPVMLTKLTPTGPKKPSPPSSKGKSSKQNDKIFIKLPLFTKPKKKLQRKKFGPPHSPSRAIPTTPSVDDLNRIFSVELRPLTVRIEHIDLSSYLNKTISHAAGPNRQPRKPKKEEFIGLDEEDVVELQNTSMNSSISKRKSILITERTESPNSAKKKVKFSDSPSIKYVDKLDFSDDENNSKDKSDDDEDYVVKKGRKPGPKPQNGTSSPSTPENGKKRRGRPPKKKEDTDENGEEAEKEENVEKTKEDTVDDSGAKEDKEEEATKESPKEDAEGDAKEETVSNQEADEQKSESEETKAVTEEKPEGEEKSEVHEEESIRTEEPKDETSAGESVAAEEDKPSPEASATAAMETEDADTAEPMKVDQTEQPPVDTEMKTVNSPEDVEMTETKSPPAEDVEMKEIGRTSPEPAETEKEGATLSNDASPEEAPEKVDSVTEPTETINSTKDEEHPVADFETSDKEEEEMEKFKQTLSNLLGEEISDSDQGLSQDGHASEPAKPVADEEHEKSESAPAAAPNDEPAEKDEPETETPKNPDPQTPPAAEESNNKSAENESPAKKDQSFASLDDVDDISDDDDILDRLDDADEPTTYGRKRSPDLPPLGEDSL